MFTIIYVVDCFLVQEVGETHAYTSYSLNINKLLLKTDYIKDILGEL